MIILNILIKVFAGFSFSDVRIWFLYQSPVRTDDVRCYRSSQCWTSLGCFSVCDELWRKHAEMFVTSCSSTVLMNVSSSVFQDSLVGQSKTFKDPRQWNGPFPFTDRSCNWEMIHTLMDDRKLQDRSSVSVCGAAQDPCLVLWRFVDATFLPLILHLNLFELCSYFHFVLLCPEL